MSEGLVKVGVGVFVLRNGKVLLQQRKGAHGEGAWGLPGGHLEFKESIEECARREVDEETGMKIKNIRLETFTNDIFEKENKHYITIFVLADHAGGDPRIKEPDKTIKQDWFTWNSLPSPLFIPLQNLIKRGYNLGGIK